MQKKSFLLAIMFFMLVSCTALQTKNGGSTSSGKSAESGDSAENALKGTNTEIMNAFKSLLARYEFEQFSMATLKIVTKMRKLTETDQYYEEYKRAVDTFEQYDISMKREGYDMIVNIKYSIFVQEMNMKTNTIGYKEVAREQKAEKELLEKVKRLLYGM